MPENENMPDSTTPDATTDATTDTAAQTPEKAQTTQPNEKGQKDGEPEQKVDTTDKAAKSAKTDKPKASRPTHPEPVHSTSDRSETLRRVDGREMRLAVGNSPFPVEQTEAWERFEEAMGRPYGGATSMRTRASQ